MSNKSDPPAGPVIHWPTTLPPAASGPNANNNNSGSKPVPAPRFVRDVTNPFPRTGEPPIIKDATVFAVNAVPIADATAQATTFEDAIFGPEIDVLVKLFDADFKVDEAWDAMEAVAALGRKATAFLKRLGIVTGPAGTKAIMAACPPPYSAAVTPREAMMHDIHELRGRIPALQLHAATFPAGGNNAVQGVILDKALAAIITRIATAAVQKLLDYLNSLSK